MIKLIILLSIASNFIFSEDIYKFIWTNSHIGEASKKMIRTDINNEFKYFDNTHSYAINKDGTLWRYKDEAWIPFSSRTLWKEIHVGSQHSIALRDNGTIFTWGKNSDGALGLGTQVWEVEYPTQIGFDEDWVDVTAGTNFSLAVKKDGTLWGWGSNYKYALSEDNIFLYGSEVPIRVGKDNDWARIYCTYFHIVGLKKDGSLWEWGANDILGFETIEKPKRIGKNNDWLTVSIGDEYVLALKKDSTLWGYGTNLMYQLGDSTFNGADDFKKISENDKWKSFSTYFYTSFGIKADGTLWTWGYNTLDDLNEFTDEKNLLSTPTQIGQQTDWIEVKSSIFKEVFLATKKSKVLPVESNLDEEISYYPIPFDDYIYLDITLDKKEFVEISVQNLFGENLEYFNKSWLNKGENSVKINLKNYKKGIYFISLKYDNKVITKKIIK